MLYLLAPHIANKTLKIFDAFRNPISLFLAASTADYIEA
jgi:hypothetical protein